MEQTLHRLGVAHDLGIRMFQISLPSWGALDEGEALLFFQTVCGAFPDSQFLHYNLPRAGRILRGAEYATIAEAVPNLVATKNSSTDYARTADLLINAPQLQHFLLERNFRSAVQLANARCCAVTTRCFPVLRGSSSRPDNGAI